MRVAVLAYHSQNVNGNDYSSNDHLALTADLAEIRRRKLPLLPLRQVVHAVLSGDAGALPPVAVALSCDDGTLLDWEDFEHPVHGWQRAFAGILAEHLDLTDESPEGLLTAFVIASPEARREIDAGCHGGFPLSDERWWSPAAANRLVAVENHSWDHLHPCVATVAHSRQAKGDFSAVKTWADADSQIRQAADHIDRVLAAVGARTTLFAYPYGHVSDYLADEYFPGHQGEHRMLAAFTTAPAVLTEQSERYRLPRFVCGEAWRSPEEFMALLDRLSGREENGAFD
jgi:hypothetical protein